MPRESDDPFENKPSGYKGYPGVFVVFNIRKV